jgi:hypothetical protein
MHVGGTGTFGFPDGRSGGMLEFDPGSAFRSDGLRSNLKKRLLGPEVAAREPWSLVFGLPPTAALVSMVASFKIS